METAAQSIAAFYDEVPYESRPFAQSHPARLAAIAELFGLDCPPLAHARVLELGCSAAGNLIPLAAQNPQAQFTGLDLSAVQIGQGLKRIGALNLGNITLHNMSIADVRPEFGTFDYIICHGVYSWVPPSVQDAILRVAQANLAENGVAYVSYNVFPGWRLRGALREALSYHVQDEPNPLRRTQLARQFLDQLSNATNAATPYGQMLRQEAKNFATLADYYITHEYFEPDNHPCYVSEFIAKARSHGLEFLTESDFSFTIAETFGADNGALLRALSGNRLDRMEQYIDFFSGRTFRQSLLVHTERSRSTRRTLEADRLKAVWVAARLERSVREDGIEVFADRVGRTLSTKDTFVASALARLSDNYPNAFRPGDLVREVRADAEPQHETAVLDALFKMATIGMCELSSVEFPVERSVSDRPEALKLARIDAAQGQSWTTNASHETVTLSPVQRSILPLLDGTNGKDEMVRHVGACVEAGEIYFMKDGRRLDGAGEIEASIAEHVQSSLEALARSGVLVA